MPADFVSSAVWGHYGRSVRSDGSTATLHLTEASQITSKTPHFCWDYHIVKMNLILMIRFILKSKLWRTFSGLLSLSISIATMVIIDIRVFCVLDRASSWYLNKGSGSACTRIPHHQQSIPLHNTNTPQVSLHNNTPCSRKLLKMDVLTSETCWAVNWHNKASVIKLVYLYSNRHKSVYFFPKIIFAYDK